MLTTKVKNILLISAISSVLTACGGGSGGSDDPDPIPNTAPTLKNFVGTVSASNPLAYNFTWEASDADNDTLTCTLNPGEGVDSITISDCANTSSSDVIFAAAGDYSASLSVKDPSNASATSTTDITVEEGGLPDPVVVAGENELVIFYSRPDNTYTDWVVHLWNNAQCDSYADFASDKGTDWETGQAQAGVDPTYGAYWVIDLKDGYSDCSNFLIHKGDEKALGDSDSLADLTGERNIWTINGFTDLFTEPTLAPSGIQIANIAAHWVTAENVFWSTGASNVAKVRVYSSDVTELGFNGETGIAGDNYVEYAPHTSGTHPATELDMPRYSAQDAFTATNVGIDKVKSMLTGKLVAIAYDDSDAVVAATYVQSPRIIDDIYTTGTDDADEATLGLIYDGNDIDTKLWAPTAQQVSLNIYNADKTLKSTEAMELDSATGIWSFSADNSVDRLFYRYELTVFHSKNNRFETIEVTDPYSVSLSTNGSYSQFVNLMDADLMPSGWEDHAVPVIADAEDAVIYEGHIRDFSIRDESTTEANRGKYLAFTEENSVPVQHLKALAEAGLTHFQMLPANDIASIDEDLSNRVNLTDTVDDLCAADSSAPVCGVEDGGATLISIFESYDPSSEDAQALAQSLRGLDSFNWGYDPKHFNTPDGSYASNPDGVSRILEMREMNQAVHEIGLRVVLDVVYNHTNSSGLYDNSVLDKVVPGYYHRRDLVSGNVLTDTCCQDTAPEHRMMDKLMADSLVQWAEAYKFDGFRFDIMSNNSVESIVNARTAVQAIDPDNYFYGEGWTRNDNGYDQAQQNNMAGTEVGTFNDRPRDTIRGAGLFSGSSKATDQDTIRLGLAGTLEAYELQDSNGIVKLGKNFSQSSYAKDPADIINYVSKHDNETLWDQLQYGLPTTMSVADRVRAQNIAATIPLMSQGIPFFQFGGDFIRSKSMDRNTYDAGDWFNLVDFTQTTNNWNVGLPLAEDNESKWTSMTALNSNSETAVQSADIAFASDVFKEFLQIRKESKLFRLTTADDVIARVGFHNTGSGQTAGLLVMSIDDGLGLTDLDSANDAIVVVINGTSDELSHTISTATGFELHDVQVNSADDTVALASFAEGTNEGTFTVPALTTAVFVKPQSGAQGNGLKANATVDQPDVAPYGDTEVFLRGSMNDWGTDNELTYIENGEYSIEIVLDAGEQNLKIAADDWSVLDLGYSDVTFGSNSIAATTNSENHIIFTADTAGNYSIIVDASSTTPVVTISTKNTTVDCTALVDSTDANPFAVTGGGDLYVRGDHSGWGADAAYKLSYKGNKTYQAVADFDGSMQFKLASDDGSWTTQLWAQADGSTDINTGLLEVGIGYPVAYEDAGTDNNQADLPAGTYSVLLTLNEENPAKGFDIGTLLIQECKK